MKNFKNLLAKIFANLFTFFDNLTTVNDSGEFEEIFPPEDELKIESLSNNEG